jgi:hypothetical protein
MFVDLGIPERLLGLRPLLRLLVQLDHLLLYVCRLHLKVLLSLLLVLKLLPALLCLLHYALDDSIGLQEALIEPFPTLLGTLLEPLDDLGRQLGKHV